jgi:PIN domain
VLDACVLYPAPLRDILIEAARSGLYRARWTEQIHDEWTRSLLVRRPELGARLERKRRLMNEAVDGCVVSGFEARIDGISLPDPGDRHVLAAAVHCGADAIVTVNLKDFPAAVLERYGVRAWHPDDFLMDHFAREPAKLVMAVQAIRLRLRNPPRTVDEYLATLEAQGLQRFVNGVRVHASLC